MLRRSLLNTAYTILAVVALPFVLWRRVRHGKRTPALWKRLAGCVEAPTKNATRIWIHAVSVGEVLQARPLIRELRQLVPNSEIILSATTASGLQLAREKYADCVVIPFPFDFSWAVRRAFHRIKPDAVALVELELWPNFIAEADRQEIPLLVANGRLSEKSHTGYRKLAAITQPMFRNLNHVCAQNDAYKHRFIDLGVASNNVSVTGSIKFDGLATDRNRPQVQTLRDAFEFSATDSILMAGSTHDPEESLVAEAWEALKATHPNLKLLIVPRHPERFDAVASMLEDRGHHVRRRSTANRESAASTSETVYLLDTVGELSACWGLADIAFVGGTLTKRGGQNMLEPAAYGCPVIMGPNVWNFSEIAAGLLEAGGARTVSDVPGLTATISKIADNPCEADEMAAAARSYASSQSGAAKTTANAILELIKSGDAQDASVPRPQQNTAA